MLHVMLTKLPKPLDLDGLISRALALQEKYPAKKLSTWSTVSRYSVLKATGPAIDAVTGVKPASIVLAEAEQLFMQHSRQMDRQKRRKEILQALYKRRTPAMTIGLTVLIALASVGLEMYSKRHGEEGMTRWLLWKAVSMFRG